MSGENKKAGDDLILQLEAGATQTSEEPNDVKEGHRSELVCVEDCEKVMDMDKVSLQKYSHSRLGKELDLSRRIKQLKTDVILAIHKKLELVDAPKPDGLVEEAPLPEAVAEFVFNPKNRRIFEQTELLLKRTDLIPCHVCDEKGKRL